MNIKNQITFRILIYVGMLAMPLLAKAQRVASDLPKTWEMRVNNSLIRTTLHEDGRLTSQTIFGCFSCAGSGMCQVCSGTGGQYWYGLGIQACGACFGSGRCGGCSGKGYTVQNSTTKYGVTVVYDEKGNMYVVGGSGGSSSRGKRCREREKKDHIEYLTGYGENLVVYCSKCKKYWRRHVHVLR